MNNNEKSNYLDRIIYAGRIGMDSIIPILIAIILVGAENIIGPEIERFGARIRRASRGTRCHSFLQFLEIE